MASRDENQDVSGSEFANGNKGSLFVVDIHFTMSTTHDEDFSRLLEVPLHGPMNMPRDFRPRWVNDKSNLLFELAGSHKCRLAGIDLSADDRGEGFAVAGDVFYIIHQADSSLV